VVNTKKIKGRMAELGLTQKQVSDKLGIVKSTFNQKLNNTNKRQFNITEVQELTKILCIDDPKEFFFTR
jgi:transcriptional regulator with XRE-family HTH domain